MRRKERNERWTIGMALFIFLAILVLLAILTAPPEFGVIFSLGILTGMNLEHMICAAKEMDEKGKRREKSR